MRRAVPIAALLAALTCAIAVPRTPSPQRKSLVVVTLDTTRADTLPAYGFRGVATPAIDGLAAEGTTFDNAESVAPLTLTAHTSLFTGLYPPHHGVRDNVAPPLAAAHATLSESLRRVGFRTAAFVGSAVLRRDRGLARGFDLYDDGTTPGGPTPGRRSAEQVVDAASAWVAGLGRERFFLWLHLYDAHAPQTLPTSFRRESGDGYAAAIGYMDSQLARLLAVLQARNLLESTVIVVAADHGESLGDHGEREHGIFVYESVLRVPLIVRAPGMRPRRAADVVSLVDVAPTALDLLGVPPLTAVDGRSLLPAVRGERLAARAVYAESMYPERFGWSPLRMLRDERFKFIDAPKPELYDLAVDRFELRNLVAQRTAMAAAMSVDLAAVASGAAHVGRLPDSETLRDIVALGYVAHAPTARRPAEGAPLDPKDYIHRFNKLTESRSRSPR